MGTNKIIISSLLVISFIIVVIGTTIKVYNNHIDSEYKVIEKKIYESTKKCYLDNNCTGNSITLNDLYKKKYITETMINPRTKEKLDKNIKIKKINDKYYIKIN